MGWELLPQGGVGGDFPAECGDRCMPVTYLCVRNMAGYMLDAKAGKMKGSHRSGGGGGGRGGHVKAESFGLCDGQNT